MNGTVAQQDLFQLCINAHTRADCYTHTHRQKKTKLNFSSSWLLHKHSRPVQSLTLICFCINVGECRARGGGVSPPRLSFQFPSRPDFGKLSAELTHNQPNSVPLSYVQIKDFDTNAAPASNEKPKKTDISQGGKETQCL